MKLKMNIFGKMITLILLLLTPIIILYGYFHHVSVEVVRENIDKYNNNRLNFFMSQMENAVDQLTKFSVIASRDSSLKEYLNGRNAGTPVAQLQRKLRVVEMLNTQIATSGWNNQITLHLIDSKEVISTDYSVEYDDNYLKNAVLQKWMHRTITIYGATQQYFSRIRQSDIPDILIEVKFTDDNIKNMLNQLKQEGESEPFLFYPGMEPILNDKVNQSLANYITSELSNYRLEKSGSLTISFKNQEYIVNYKRSESLDWYLIDVIPLQNILSPITKNGYLFYASLGLLLVLSVLAALLLYRNVQKPIKSLMNGVKKINSGQYSARLEKLPNNEFDFLFLRFNEMAERIEDLIEKVYKEKIRSREATLKQLQSQINPHFLYNCLFYIKNMASLGNKEAVVAMSLNLGKYYRYTTRLEKTMTTVREEIKLLENYLAIQNLRIERFHYDLSLPEEMLDLEIPKLLLQPIVENAVIHGIEESPSFGIIQLSGERIKGMNKIIVEDNGTGLSNEKIEQLQKTVSQSIEDETGFGLWNIHQRLQYLYKGKSGLYLSPSPLGGLRVELLWEDSENQNGD